MPSFKFSEYTEPELLACGDAFLASCRKIWDETGAPWLWIDLPDEDTPKNCQYVMFGDRRGTVRCGPP
jgi:hypothetical protein